MTADSLLLLLQEIGNCQECAAQLIDGVRPVVQAGPTARLLIIGQAPGRRVHESGIPWDDASGNRLRKWLQLDRDDFYDPGQVALVPMGFCFPGSGRSGDLPPRPECAPLWHRRLLDQLPQIQLTLLIGRFAQQAYLSDAAGTLTETVGLWQDYAPQHWPLPHPSPRNNRWLKQNPWFEKDLLPSLRTAVKKVLSGDR